MFLLRKSCEKCIINCQLNKVDLIWSPTQANLKPIIELMFLLPCLFVVVVVLLFQILMNVLQKPIIAVLMPFAIIPRVHTTTRANLDTMETERTAAEVNNPFMMETLIKGGKIISFETLFQFYCCFNS